MADFDFSTLITDRGQSDLATLRSVLSTPMEEWTAEQLAAFNLAASKGAYNYTDLNRVTACMDNLNERLTALGYQTGYQPIIVHPKEPEPVNPLPEGYTQVAWIESTGSQYIDTDVLPDQNSGIELKIEFTHDPASAQEAIYGTRTADTKQFWAYYRYNSDAFAMRFGTTSTNFMLTMPAIGTHIIEQTKNVFNVDGEQTSAPMMDFTSTYPIYLFAVNNQGSVQYPASVRIFCCKIYDNETLIRDYLPCISPNGEAGLYDLVNDQFYGNSGTGTFLPGPAQVELPDGYTQLEYIESTGTQYINTGINPDQDTRAIVDVQIVSTPNADNQILSCRSTETGPFWIIQVNKSTVTTWRTRYANQMYQDFSSNLDVYQRTLIDKNKNITTIGDEIKTFNYSQFNIPYPLTIFARLTGNTNVIEAYSIARVYCCKIYRNEILLCDFIPCKNSMGNIGLYNLVNGQFYGNAGTGIFTAGPEVSWPEPAPDPEPALDPYIWYEIDVPTASAMAAYLANVAALRGVLTLPDNTAAVPADMDGLTVDEANAIEEILLVIEDYLTALQKIFLRSGMAWAVSGGPGFYFKN